MIDRNDPYGLLRLLPRVRRARGFRLYTETGARILDLWQYGGAAILGHTPPRVLLAFKDTASRGLFCPMPSFHERCFEQSLSRLVPGRSSVRWYAGAEEADRALSAAGFGSVPLSSFADPALADPPSDCRAAFWRPWVPTPQSYSPPILSPVIPLPHPARPVAFLLSDEVSARFPVSGPVSPVMLAAASRALSDLSTELTRARERRSHRLEKIFLSISGSSCRGPYVVLPESRDPDAYAVLFKKMLRCGFLLPPDPSLPLILPADLSEGEEKALSSAIAGR